LQATGLGAYIAQTADDGDFQKLALGIMVMSLYVLVINRIVWRPLYNLAVERYQQ
jgi:NitT/TauT family transport system permease protein